MEKKIIAVIPAHLASVRFPKKILFEFGGLPMIEHVRRRALMCAELDNVYVATCDEEITEAIRSFGGNVIMTGNHHTNGTSRVAEAVENVDCSHIILLQGDEPLLLPRHVDTLIDEIKSSTETSAWNVTGPIENAEELDRHSFVKCATLADNQIAYCFRRSPSSSTFEIQKQYIRKILGIIAFEKNFLMNLTKTEPTKIETAEFIEQMRIIEMGYRLKSVPVPESLPSVNEPHEAQIVLEYVERQEEQLKLFNQVVGKIS